MLLSAREMYLHLVSNYLPSLIVLVSVPPLENFVMNRVLGDYFETLLYKIFVSIDEHTTVAEVIESVFNIFKTLNLIWTLFEYLICMYTKN